MDLVLIGSTKVGSSINNVFACRHSCLTELGDQELFRSWMHLSCLTDNQ